MVGKVRTFSPSLSSQMKLSSVSARTLRPLAVNRFMGAVSDLGQKLMILTRGTSLWRISSNQNNPAFSSSP